MKQIGNLAIICAQHPEVLFSVYQGQAAVIVPVGTGHESFTADWADDEVIRKIEYELNHGKYRKDGSSPTSAAPLSVYVCYEENCPSLARDSNCAVDGISVFLNKSEAEKWVRERLENPSDNFFVDKELTPEAIEQQTKSENTSIEMFRDRQENWDGNYSIIAKRIEIK